MSGSEYLSLCYAVNSMENVHALDSFIISRTTETKHTQYSEKNSKWSAEHFSWSILDLFHTILIFLRLLQSLCSTPLHMELIPCDITFIKRERKKCVAITPQPCPYLPPTFAIHGGKSSLYREIKVCHIIKAF